MVPGAAAYALVDATTESFGNTTSDVNTDVNTYVNANVNGITDAMFSEVLKEIDQSNVVPFATTEPDMFDIASEHGIELLSRPTLRAFSEGEPFHVAGPTNAQLPLPLPLPLLAAPSCMRSVPKSSGSRKPRAAPGTSVNYERNKKDYAVRKERERRQKQQAQLKANLLMELQASRVVDGEIVARTARTAPLSSTTPTLTAIADDDGDGEMFSLNVNEISEIAEITEGGLPNRDNLPFGDKRPDQITERIRSVVTELVSEPLATQSQLLSRLMDQLTLLTCSITPARRDLPCTVDAETQTNVSFRSLSHSHSEPALNSELGLLHSPSIEICLLPEWKEERKRDPVGFVHRRCDPWLSITIVNAELDLITRFSHYPSSLTQEMPVKKLHDKSPSLTSLEFRVLDPASRGYAGTCNEVATLLHCAFRLKKAGFVEMIRTPEVVTTIVVDTATNEVASACLSSTVVLDTGAVAMSIASFATHQHYRHNRIATAHVNWLKTRIDEKPGSSLSIQSSYKALSFWKSFAVHTRFAINLVFALHEHDSKLFTIYYDIVELSYTSATTAQVEV